MHWHSTHKIKVIIRMEKIIFFILILVGNIASSQKSIPETYSKIKFVYEQKSNFFTVDNKVYADTLLLKVEFPKTKFTKVVSPQDSLKIIGSVKIKSLSKEEIKRLESQLYHNTHLIQGIHNLKTNKTTLFFKRGSGELIKTYRENFGHNFTPFAYKIIIDYNKKTINTNYPKVNYSKSFQSELKKIDFVDAEKEIGSCSYQTANGIMTDIVNFNKLYNIKVATDMIFSNNDYGVEKIVSFFDTTTLTSVTYE